MHIEAELPGYGHVGRPGGLVILGSLALAALVALSLAPFTASAQGAGVPRRGGTAIVATSSEPSLLNAVISTNPPDVQVACAVYEGLVVFDAQDRAEPALATSWTIADDGRTYTFHLRDTKFHDGAPFTSEDVRFTLMEVAAKLHPTVAAQVGKLLDGVETPDPHTAVVKLKEPYGPLLRVLTCAISGGILPAHLLKGKEIASNPVTTSRPVGTGPFKFGSWVRGDHVTLVRNDGYWDAGKPYLDELVVKTMPSPGSRTQALLAGEIDFIAATQFVASDAKLVRANPGLKLERTGWAPNTLWAFLNVTRKPLDDVRVRQALLTATDRTYIFNNAFAGSGRPGSAPWTVQIPWATDPAINYDTASAFDPRNAAAMLEAAGYKADANGVRLKVSISYSNSIAELRQTASALQGAWRRAGVDVELRPLEVAVLLPRVHRDGDFDVYIASYNSFGDPAIGISRAFLTETIGRNFGNASRYSNPEVDALFARGVSLTSLDDRGAVYRDIQRILMRDMPSISLHENQGFDAANRKLHGVWGTLGIGLWGNGWMDP